MPEITVQQRIRKIERAETLLRKAGFIKCVAKGSNDFVFRHKDGRFFGREEIYNISLKRLAQFQEWAEKDD